MCACKSEHCWIVPEGLCLSLFLSHSLGTASIQPMNGQGFNYSPHLSDQIQLENEGNPRQAQSLLCNVCHGRGHPAPATRDYFPFLVSWPCWKTGTPAFGDPLRAFHIVCGLCTSPLIFLMMHWASGSPLFPQRPWWPLCMPESFPYCFLTYMLLSMCFPPSSPLVRLPHDGLTAHITRSARVWHCKGRRSPNRGYAHKE